MNTHILFPRVEESRMRGNGFKGSGGGKRTLLLWLTYMDILVGMDEVGGRAGFRAVWLYDCMTQEIGFLNRIGNIRHLRVEFQTH